LRNKKAVKANMSKATELKRLLNLVQLNENLKHYNIKQARIAEITGFTRCKVSRCLSGVQPKNRRDAAEIIMTAYNLVKKAKIEVEKMGNK
jgi:predicted XRE-type DNA-binding protein